MHERDILQYELKQFQVELEASGSEAKKTKNNFDAQVVGMKMLQESLASDESSTKEVESTIENLQDRLDRFQEDVSELGSPRIVKRI